MLSDLYENNILLFSPFLWPESLQNVLNGSIELIDAYFKEESRVDELARDDVMLRIHRPMNPRTIDFQRLKWVISSLIEQYQIISFHCTRLTQLEQEKIIKCGLEPSSSALTKHRLDEIRMDLDIPKNVLDMIISNSIVHHKNRENRVWFFHSLEQAKCECGVFELLNYWGGESTYWSHLDNSEMLDILSHIGEPCIVISLLQKHELSYVTDFEKRLLNIWFLRDKDLRILDTESYVRRKVLAQQIVVPSDPLFEQLTNSSSWRNQLSF